MLGIHEDAVQPTKAVKDTPSSGFTALGATVEGEVLAQPGETICFSHFTSSNANLL